MSICKPFFRHSQKPTGLCGRWFGRSMNIGHARLRTWGLQHVQIQPDFHILDLGCGGGKTVKVMAARVPQGKVFGIDHSPDMVRLAGAVNRKPIEEKRVEILPSSVSKLPFPDHSFDLVTAFESYYFFPDLPGGLKEIRRTIKPGGELLIVNEAHLSESYVKRNTYWTRITEMMLHSKDEYHEFLTNAGFTNISFDTLPHKNWIAIVAGAF